MDSLLEIDTIFINQLTAISTLQGNTRDSEVNRFLKRHEIVFLDYASKSVEGGLSKLLYLTQQIDSAIAPYARLALLGLHGEKLTEVNYDHFMFTIANSVAGIPAGYIEEDIGFLLLLSNVFKKYYQIACRTNKRIHFINTTHNLLLSKMKNIYSFTPIHWHFVDACVDAKLYDIAVLGLNEYFPLKIEKEIKVHHQDFLNYFTGLATCYIKTSKFKQALLCCNEVITVPAFTIVEEMNLAVRRAKLLSLIVYGKPFEFPKSTFRDFKDSWTKSDNPLSAKNKCYSELDKAFADLDSDKLQLLFAEHIEELKRCGESDILLSEVNKAVVLQSIKNITVAYLAATLENIQAKAHISSIAETEQLVSELILAGSIKARINKRKGIVQFTDLESDEKCVDFDKLRALAESTQSCLAMLSNVRKIQASALTSVDYIKKNVMVVRENGTPIYSLGSALSNSSQPGGTRDTMQDYGGDYGDDDVEGCE